MQKNSMIIIKIEEKNAKTIKYALKTFKAAVWNGFVAYSAIF